MFAFIASGLLFALRPAAGDKIDLPSDASIVRVGLTRLAGAVSLSLRALPGARLIGPDGQEKAAGTGPWTIAVTPSGATAKDARGHTLGTAPTPAAWRLQSDDADTLIGVASQGGAFHTYRGSIEIGMTANRLRAVNEVSLEAYLRGVVGSEMGGRAPLEALKAQAVASRTFALGSLGRWTSAGYDIRDSTDSQVYIGADRESPECDRAIRETSGLILTIGGRPITAYFSADCGGVTAPGASPDSCPRSVSDTDAHGPAGKPLPPAWVLTYSPERLALLLEKPIAGQAALHAAAPTLSHADPQPGPQANSPLGVRADSRSDLPAGSQPAPHTRRQAEPLSALRLDNMEVTDIDISGRVRRLRLTWVRAGVKPADRPGNEARGGDDPLPPQGDPLPDGTGSGDPGPGTGRQPTTAPLQAGAGSDRKPRDPENTVVLTEMTGSALRTLLGADTLRSTLFTVRRTPAGAFLIEGRGWGHGRGMCQVGAMSLAANQAFSFRAILDRYYAGAALTRAAGEGGGEKSEADDSDMPVPAKSKSGTSRPGLSTPTKFGADRERTHGR